VGLSLTRELNFSVDQIVMAWQKMAVLAVAGVLCMSALLNGAGASVTATNPPSRNATQASGVSVSNSWKLIDTSSSWTDESLPLLIVNGYI
jgi:hypothetical protein